MFNFFKKKNNEFKLDESILPTLSDESNLDTNPIISQVNSTQNLNNSMDSNPIDMNSNTTSTNPFNSNIDLTPINNSNNFDNQNLHNDLIKTKIDTLESKTSLIEAKINSIDQKLDVIYQLLLNEVSDETKRKFKVDSMMNNIKN